MFINSLFIHKSHTRTDFPSLSSTNRKKSLIVKNKLLSCYNGMSKDDPHYSKFPVERELVYYITSIIEERGGKHDPFGKAVWGKDGGKTWREVRRKKVSYNKQGKPINPRRINLEEIYKMAKVLNRDASELMKEAIIRYESKVKKGNHFPPKSTPPAQSA